MTGMVVLRLFILLTLSLGLISCRNQTDTIVIDGSSTLHALAETAVVNLVAKHRVSLTMSGSGTGIDRLCRGDATIALMSRPISSLEERRCAEANLELLIFPIARDEVAFVVPRANDWLHSVSLEEVSSIWGSDFINRWSDLRPTYPDSQIHRFAPGISSGTRLVALKAIFGPTYQENSIQSLTNVMAEDDYILATHLARTNNGIGILPGVYATHFKSELRRLKVTNFDNAQSSLERVLSIVVDRDTIGRKEVMNVVDILFNAERTYGSKLGYLPLKPDEQALRQRLVDEVHPNEE